MPHCGTVKAVECTINLSQQIPVGVSICGLCISIDRADRHGLIIEQALLLLGETSNKAKPGVVSVSSDTQSLWHERQV